MTSNLIAATPAATGEGPQEMRSRSELTAKEVLREVGSVLRMSEKDAAELRAVLFKMTKNKP